MDVDDFSHWLLLQQGMGTEAEEIEVVVDVGDAPQLVIHVVNVIEMQLDLDSKYCGSFISRVALEARQRRQQYYDSKFFLLFVGLDDPFAEVLGDCILSGDEELVFDVYELLCASDELEVSIEDGVLCFSLFQADRPHRLAPQNLLGLIVHGFAGLNTVACIFLQHHVFEASSVAVVDDILGVEVVQQLLELIHVLQVSRIELHLLFVAEVACPHLENARTVAQLGLLLPQTNHLRYRLAALIRFLLAPQEVESGLFLLLLGLVHPKGFPQSSQALGLVFLLGLALNLGFVNLYLGIAEADVHEQLSVIHAELEIDVVPVLDEMAGEVLH